MSEPTASPPPDRTSDACENCGRRIDPSDRRSARGALCLECAIASAESRLDFEDATPTVMTVSDDERRDIWKRTAIAAAAVAVAAAVVAWPTLMPAGGGSPPLREGTAETDVAADECIENVAVLFSLAGSDDALENAEDFECPATDRAYVITWSDGYVPGIESVACPDPAAHGLSGITMEADDTIPTVEE